MRKLPGALFLILGTITGANAQDLLPIHAQTIDLGSVRGSAYYTVEADGYRVVATLASEGAAAPVRFVTTLASDEKVTIAVPREIGQNDAVVDIVRRGDSVTVEQQLPIVATN